MRRPIDIDSLLLLFKTSQTSFGLYSFEECIVLVEVGIWVDLPRDVVASAWDLVLYFELGVDCAVDEFHHLGGRHYFVSERSDEENGLLGQDDSVLRGPEVGLQECERR